MRAYLGCVLALILGCPTLPAAAEPFASGASERILDIGGIPLHVYAYKPPEYRAGDILLVLHGLGRNAAGYRQYAKPLAHRYGFLVIAPLFDRQRFPTWRYQQGGIARATDDAVQAEPEDRWVSSTVNQLIEEVRRAEGAPSLPYSILGHSAGAQALTRYAAFGTTQARRLIIANPSTYLWPASDVRFPYGLGGLPSELANDAVLRRYLALPIVVLLGTADVRRDRDLNVTPGAARQGASRHERGLNYFRAGERLAHGRGWPFGWRLIEVPGVGHSARLMFDSEAAASAFAD
ncbi:MAG: alpha/beta hydrolase [Rhodospirillaceae bacterium]